MTTNTHILTINNHLNMVKFIVRSMPDSTDKQALITLIDDAIDHLMEANTNMANQTHKISELMERISVLTKSIYEPIYSAQYAYPAEGDYNAVREYVEHRKAHDNVFKNYCLVKSRKQLCDRLSEEFGWVVDVKSYGRNIQRH